MYIQEAKSISEMKNLLIRVANNVPLLENYKDLMLSENEKSWKGYRFLGDFQRFNGLVGINQENGINCYTKKVSGAFDLINKTKSIVRLEDISAFRGNSIIAQRLFGKYFEITSKSKRKIVVHFCFSPISKEKTSLSLRNILFKHNNAEKTKLDWTKPYNNEMNTSFNEDLSHYIADGRAFEFLLGDEVVGYVLKSIKSEMNFWLGRLYIKKEYRSEGLAQEAINSIKNYCYENKLTIHAHSNINNATARRLFERSNFQSVGEILNASFT